MGFNWKRCAWLALTGVSLLVFGCGGGAGGAGGVSQPAATFTLSGQLNGNGAGLAGVTVNLSGASSSTLTSGAGGGYSVNLPSGQYTLTPSLAGYSFFPASQTMTVANGNITVPDFTASVLSSSFTVSGRVTLNGTPLPGAALTLTGAGSGSVSSDASGTYSFSGVQSGNCTITPVLPGFTFTPLSQVVTVVNGNASAPDFTASPTPPATPATFTLSGTVSLNGSGLSGATVSISGAGSGSITTLANGAYSFVGVRNGTYTITPSIPGYSFTPSSASLSVQGAGVSGLNFSAVPPVGGSITITF